MTRRIDGALWLRDFGTQNATFSSVVSGVLALLGVIAATLNRSACRLISSKAETSITASAADASRIEHRSGSHSRGSISPHAMMVVLAGCLPQTLSTLA
jgi:hypothetical protein